MRKIEEIFQYIDRKALSRSEFERLAGFSNGYLTNTLERGSDITDKILERFRQKSPTHYKAIFGEKNHTPVAPQQPQGGQQTSPAHDNGVTQEMTMRGILALVESNRALGIANQNLTESNLILSRELSGGLNKETELILRKRILLYRELIFQLGVGKGKRWKDEKSARQALNNLLVDKLEGNVTDGKKLETDSQHKG